VDAKKLRYALEIAEAARVWPGPPAVSTLKKTQEVLGRLHDRQVLIDMLNKHTEIGSDERRRQSFEQILEAERDDLHARYIARRPELLAVCAAAQRLEEPPAGRHGARESLVACGAGALPVALWILTRDRGGMAAHRTSQAAVPRPVAEPVSAVPCAGERITARQEEPFAAYASAQNP
jgi:hypothetical protein